VFPPQSIRFERDWLQIAENYWWHEEIPDGTNMDNVTMINVPGGFVAVYVPRPKYYRKYIITFEWYEVGAIGNLITFYGSEGHCLSEDTSYHPNTGGYGSERSPFRITDSLDGRIVINPHSHDGWPGSIIDSTDIMNENWEIEVFVEPGNGVLLISDIGVLSQMPEVIADGFRVNTSTRIYGMEFVLINYHERAGSLLWQWLMTLDNTWKFSVCNPLPEIIENDIVPVREITNNLWEMWGIQAFEYGGDVTLIGRLGALSQIPEFNEDEHYFSLETTGEFELLYIMYHEREGSGLWQLLMPSE
jgi:hypothetical protein